MSIVDVLEQIIAHNDGDVAVKISISVKCNRSDDSGLIDIMIDDGDGLPDLGIQTIKQGDEWPLMHTQDVALVSVIGCRSS